MRTEAHEPPLRILIVDDHSLLVEALRLSLSSGDADRSAIEVVTAPSLDRDEILDVADHERPDVILVDLDLGDGRAGTDIIRPLSAAGHRVVLFTGATEARELGDGLDAGASGIVRKTEPFHRLVISISDAASGRNLGRPAEREELIAASRRSRVDDDDREARLASLSRREREILDQLAQGSTAAQVASDSFVSLATVRSQIKSILRKLGVSSQLAAVAIARSE